MMLFKKPEILIFKVLRTSGSVKEINTNFRMHTEFVLISFIKPEVRKTLNANFVLINCHFCSKQQLQNSTKTLVQFFLYTAHWA